MKILFIEAKYKGKINIDESIIKKLPKKLGLISSVQFAGHLEKIKKDIIKKNKKVFLKKGKQKYKGQVLGCDLSAADINADAILYIGDGKFHPLGVAIKTGIDVFCFNPITNHFSKIDKKEIEKYNKRKKAAYINFLSSDKIGVLVSSKHGQNNLKQALNLKNKFKDKQFYYFVFNTLDINQLENFPFVQAWVNTACPRLFDDFLCINLEDLK